MSNRSIQELRNRPFNSDARFIDSISEKPIVQMPYSSSRADRLSLETQIVGVTAYPNQARVTRRGHVEVTQKLTVLEIGDLPGVLQPESLQAYPRGSAQVILGALQLEQIETPAAVEQSKAALAKHLHEIEAAFRDCKDRLVALNLQRTFLEGLAERSPTTLAQGLSQQSTSLEDIAQTLEFLETTYQQVAAAIAKQERLKHDLDRQLQAARQHIQQFQAQLPLSQYRVLLPLQVEQPGMVELELAYLVTQVQWQQAYDIRLADDQKTVQINRIAQVCQNTGEAWEAVPLKVTTAVADKNPEIPQPSLWRIQVSQQASQSDRRDGSAANLRTRSAILDDAYRMLGAVPGSEIPPALDEEEASAPVVSTIHALLSFSALEPVEIPSDSRPYRIPIGQMSLDNQLTYLALPQRSSAPYLQARLTNPLTNQPLLPGAVALFRAGGYIGQEHLEYVAPGASFDISLGLDERVSVQRELVKKETQVSDQCRNLRSYRLTLHNPFEYAITITVIEQVPVSQNNDIQVSLLEADPDISAAHPGYYHWSIRLEAQETRRIHYQYVVEHPGDVPIMGLDG